jgi:hypothetical protein
VKRRLFNFVAALSLVLAVAILALWVRSYWVSDWIALIHRHAPGRVSSISAATWSGAMGVYLALPSNGSDYGDRRDTLFQYNPQPIDVHGLEGLYPFPPNYPRWLGFGWLVGTDRRSFLLVVPNWFAATMASAAAWLALRKARRHWRARRLGCCPRCGYDLRATPDRCPECGAAPKTEPRPAA